MGSTKVTDEKLERTLAREAPCTLPHQAYGPDPVEWFTVPRPVWAWVQWRDRPAERVPGVARGANDRVVMIAFDIGGGPLGTGRVAQRGDRTLQLKRDPLEPWAPRFNSGCTQRRNAPGIRSPK